MIYYCTDFRNVSVDLLTENIPENESFRINNLIKNPERRLQSAAAWALLSYAANLCASTKTGRDDAGKPFIVGKNIEFSVSHCKKCVAVAVSDDAIGVDAETIPEKYPQDAAKRFFSTELCKHIADSSAPNVEFCFKWTQFESFVKAGGNPSDFEKADPSFFHSAAIDGAVLSFYSAKPHAIEPVSVKEFLSREN